MKERIERLRGMLRSPSTFETDIGGNHVSLLADGDQCLGAMLEAIAWARYEILLEMYWFASDRTGRRFAEALSARAREGIKVCVIYDSVGSFGVDEKMFAEMRKAGCEVIEYNPISPFRRRFRLGVLNNRDHRKILVVDSRVAMTGGTNLGDPWASIEEGGEGWRDDMVRIEGPAAERMRGLFLQTWKSVGGKVPDSRMRRDSRAPRQPGDSNVRILTNNYRGERAAIRRAYLSQIVRSQSHVYIENSYFVPDRVVRLALAAAARRGVDVRVLLPGRSDVVAVQYAAQRLYTWLLENGVRLFEWQGPVLHSKSAIVDGEWATVGTYNLDYRSWRFNLEVNVSISDGAFARALGARILRDLDRATEIKLDQWRYRSIGRRFIEQFFYLFRRLL